MNVDRVLGGAHGSRLAGAVTRIAEKVEAAVKGAVAAPVQAGKSGGVTPGACVIKQVRRANGRQHNAKLVPASNSASVNQQPHISVVVTPLGAAAPSKWEAAGSQP